MKKPLLLCISLIPLLLSCAGSESSSSSSSTSSYPAKALTLLNVDTDKPLVDRNGDEVLGGYSSYEDTSSFFDASEAISFASKGGSLFFIVASYSCHPCQSFEPILFESMKDSPIRIGALYRTESNKTSFESSLVALKNAYGDDKNTGVDGATPRLYHLSGSSCTMMNMYSSNDTATHFSRYVSQNMSANNIFHFSSFASYSKGLEIFPDALTFLYDYNEEGSLDYYMNNLYQTAKISAKPLLLIDYRLFDKENKALLEKHFNLDSLTSSIIVGSYIKNIKSEADEATSLINNYYSLI